jgi:hypothetical protein
MAQSGGSQFPPLAWIEASANPFGVRLLDCRPITQTLTALSQDQRIAENFVTRSKQAEDYRDRVPEDSQPIPCQLRYTVPEHFREMSVKMPDRMLFIAPEMEYKWDLALVDGVIYMLRSWTSRLHYKVPIKVTNGVLAIDGFAAGAEALSSGGEFAVRLVDYLVRSAAFRENLPVPLPPDIENQAEQQIGLVAFSMYGRMAHFGTFADTTTVKSLE